MPACDFFPADCAVTLRRISVFFVLEIGTRAGYLVGTTSATAPSPRPSPATVDHPVAALSQERITRHPILDGLINEYERAA
jgi:hypothetical protein